MYKCVFTTSILSHRSRYLCLFVKVTIKVMDDILTVNVPFLAPINSFLSKTDMMRGTDMESRISYSSILKVLIFESMAILFKVIQCECTNH